MTLEDLFGCKPAEDDGGFEYNDELIALLYLENPPHPLSGLENGLGEGRIL